VTEDGRYLVLTVRAGSTIRNRVFYKDLTDPDARVVELIPEDDALYSFIGNDGSLLWFHTDRDAPRGRVIEIDVARPEPDRWLELIPQGDAAIQYVNVVADRFIVMYAEDARHEVEVFDLRGRLAYDLKLPGLGSVWAGFSGRRSDSLAFYRFNGLSDPGTVYRLDVLSGESAIFRRPDLPFDPSDFVTEQVFYRSADGTQVPMFVAYRKGFEPDGRAAAFIYAYGAFGWSAMPWYQPHWLVWMEMGGVFALPNVRGGGEYGEEWHRAGIKANKKNTVDDYIGAAEWLVRERYSSRGLIVANGGSASAPLAATALIRRPGLFGAGLLDVPTLDMLRFVEWTGGQRLIPEYGDPEDPAELDALLDFSPYQNLEDGECYPATLIAASERDEVAPPAHAYKFTAAMQHAQGCENSVLLRVARGTGHSIGATPAERVEGWADEMAFLVKSLNIELGEIAFDK
jgi:prolyl oligopeptidase